MEKDKTIIELTNKINHHAEWSSLQIVDFWEADLCAIGLKKENRLIYINTYNYVGATEIKYDLVLELLKDNKHSTVVRAIREVSETQLFTEIKQFLA